MTPIPRPLRYVETTQNNWHGWVVVHIARDENHTVCGSDLSRRWGMLVDRRAGAPNLGALCRRCRRLLEMADHVVVCDDCGEPMPRDAYAMAYRRCDKHADEEKEVLS